MTIRRFAFVVFTVWMGLMLATPIAHADQMRLEEGLAALAQAERAQNWSEAKRLGQQLEQVAKGDDLAALKAHLVKLDGAIGDFYAAEGHFKVGDLQGAVTLLQNNLKQISKNYTDLDNALLEAVMAERDRYRQALFDLNKQRLDQDYARILRIEEDGRYADAVTKMKALVEQADNQVEQSVLWGYKDKLEELESKQYDQEHPSVWASSASKLWEQFTEGGWPIVLLIFSGIYLIYRIVFKPFHADFLEITLDDQSEADKDKAEANKVLSQEFDQCLKRIIGEINEGGELDGLIDLEGAELAGGSTRRDEGAQVAEYLQSDPIQVGVLSFSPRSLFDLLRYATRTRGNTVITGALFKETGNGSDDKHAEYVMHIEKRRRSGARGRGRTAPVNRFFEGRGATRSEAMDQAAMQLVVSESTAKVTGDWRSLEALVRAKGLLEDQIEYSLSTKRAKGDEKAGQPADDSQVSILDKLNAAKSLLRKSLAIDPSNWVARYRLANVLRKIGDDRTAYWQYSYVVDMMCSEKEKQRDNLFEYIKKRATFPFTVVHKKTLSMARLGGGYLKSNSDEARQAGFELVGNALADLRLLAEFNKQECTDEKIKVSLGAIMVKIDKIIALYAQQEGKSVIQPLGHTEDQLIQLKEQVYDRLKQEQNTQRSSLSVFDNRAEKTQEAKRETDKIIFNDLIYQINSGIADILSDLYEYHSEFNEDAYVGDDDALLQELEDLERWLFGMRMELDDRNRNAYACSHAIAHNALGRAYYVKMRNLLHDGGMETHAKAIRDHFDNAEKFLRWAIGYHLPASFAEPYVNLSSLYLKGLEYPYLRNYMPTDWKGRVEDYLQQAIRLSPNNQKAHYLLGRLYQSRMSEDVLLPEDEQATNKSFAQKALDQFEKAGEDSFSYFRSGQIHADREEYKKALAKLELCMRIYRRFDEPYQLYLDVAARQIGIGLAELAKEYNEVHARNLSKLLADVNKLAESILLNCFDGTTVLVGPVCSGKLDHSQITDCIKQLNKHETRLKDIKKKQAAAGKSKVRSEAQVETG